MSQSEDKNATCRKVLVALGSNVAAEQGDPADIVRSALNALKSLSENNFQTSRIYQTPCFPPGTGPDFVNAVASLCTNLAPEILMSRFHEIEAQFGRVRAERWGARTLDIDLLAVANQVLPDPATVRRWIALELKDQQTTAPDQLILPHPRLQERAFVLVPLADVAPEWRHPVLGRSVAEMLAALPAGELDGITPIDPADGGESPLQ